MAAVLSLAEDWKGAHELSAKELEVLKSLGGTQEDQAEVHRNMGVALGHLSRFEEAYAEYREALSMYGVLPHTQNVQAEVMYFAGDVLLQMDQRSLALEVYSKALPLYRTLAGKPDYSSYRHAICAGQAAILLAESDRGSESIGLYREALGLLEHLDGEEALCAELRRGLGIQLAKSGNIAEAQRNFSVALATNWHLLGTNLLTLDTERRSKLVRTIADCAAYLYRTTALKPDVGATAAFESALVAKSLASELSKLETFLGEPVSESAQLWELRSLVARLVLLNVSEYGKEIDENGDMLKRYAESLRKLQESLRKTGKESGSVPMITAAQVRGALRKNDIVLEYVTFTPGLPTTSEEPEELDHYGVFVVTAEAEVVMKDLGPTPPIDEAILKYRQLYNSQIDPVQFQLDEDRLAVQGAEVRRLLVDAPLKTAMAASPGSATGRIYVVPAGAISLVPFEVLPEKPAKQGQKDGWRYLVEDHEIVYLAASRNLLANKSAWLPGSSDIWVVADPEYDSALDRGSGPVTVSSATGSHKVYQDAIPNNWNRLSTGEFADFLERRARKSGLRPHRLRSPKILVFATHGYFMSDVAPASSITLHSIGGKSNFGADYLVSMDPLMRSMLVLAGANQRYHPLTADLAVGDVGEPSRKPTSPSTTDSRPPSTMDC